MLDLVTQQWFIEAVIYISAASIVIYALCWLFEQMEKR